MNRIDSKGIPHAMSQGGIPYLSMRFQASFRPSKMPPKMMNRIDSKGIPRAMSQGGNTLPIYTVSRKFQT